MAQTDNVAPKPVAAAVHAIAIAVWLGAVMASGLIAAVSFPEMKALQPTLAAYAAFEGDHAPLAAGFIAAKVFAISDFIQLGCAFVALISLLLMGTRTAHEPRPGARLLQRFTLIIAMLLVAFNVFYLGLNMTDNLRAYRQAAAAGETETAEIYRQRFAEQHPTASKVIGATGIFVLITIGAHAVGSTPRRRDEAPA